MNIHDLTHRARKVLVAVSAFPSGLTLTNQQLATALDMSPRSIQLAIAELRDTGHVTISRVEQTPDNLAGRILTSNTAYGPIAEAHTGVSA